MSARLGRRRHRTRQRPFPPRLCKVEAQKQKWRTSRTSQPSFCTLFKNPHYYLNQCRSSDCGEPLKNSSG
ncbi:hypothetical protein AOLI_G00116520 [Acnodon oligacanthus]